jgi:hypothetical protein
MQRTNNPEFTELVLYHNYDNRDRWLINSNDDVSKLALALQIIS